MPAPGLNPGLFVRGLCSAILAASAYAEDCTARVAAARAAFDNKQYAQAADSFDLAVRACPPQPSLLLDMAKAQFMAQQFERASDSLTRLVAIEPRNAAALKLLGDTLYLLGRLDDAQTSLLEAIKLEPLNPEPEYALGRICYQQGRFGDSIRHLRRVIELDPKSYRAYDNLGLAYEGMNDTPQAMANYRRAMDLSAGADPPYDWVYGNLSNLLHKSGDYKQAFQFGAEAAHRNPNSARNFFLTGRALAKLERWELAAKWLGRAVELDPKYAEARYQYATVLRKLGRTKEADQQLEAFRQISAQQPANTRR